MSESRRPRNHVIDVARAASVAVVVVFHGLLYQIRLEDGRPVVTPWAAPTFLYPLSWVLMIMPLFFVAGGFGHALVSDRARAAGSGYASYLAGRGRRLVGPVVTFVTACTALATAAAWLGWLDVASEFSRQLMQLLWFITVYLVIVAVAPAMVRLHDRFGVRVMLVLGVAAAAVDAWSFAVASPGVRNLNMVLVWPLVHQFGIAYERGWWRRGPAWRAWASILAGGAGVAALVFGLGYPASSVGFADLPIANVQPPTVAMAVLALAQCGALGLVDRSGLFAALSPAAERRLALVNALMVTVYLWHIPVIFLAGGLLLGLSLLAPALAPVALFQLTVGFVALVLLTLIAPLVGRIDLALVPPLGERQDARLAVAAFGVLFLGTLAVWQAGTVLHPARPVSTLGVLAIWAGAWLMGRASDARPAARPVGTLAELARAEE